jgi:hypothetical protein
MSHSARKAAFREVSDTCPYVDEAFDDMVYEIKRLSIEEFSTSSFNCIIERCVEIVKKQTTSLRDALILAYEEKEESECELKDQIYMLQKRIEELESRVE